MRGIRRNGIVATAVTATLLLAACSGSDTETTSETTSEAAAPTSQATTPAAAPTALEGEVNDHGTATVSGDSLEVELDDYYFQPTIIQGDPGQTVELELSNEGSAPHTFTIDDQGIDEQIDPDGTTTVQVTIPDDGSVRFYCRFHASQGMQGALVATG